MLVDRFFTQDTDAGRETGAECPSPISTERALLHFSAMKAMKGVTINRGGGVIPLRTGVEVGNHKPHPGEGLKPRNR